MAGKRRAGTQGALTELLGILLASGGFALIVFGCYNLGGFWLAAIPSGVALVWIGFKMSSGPVPPSGTRTGTTPRPEYVDPDADLPTDAYRRPRERD